MVKTYNTKRNDAVSASNAGLSNGNKIRNNYRDASGVFLNNTAQGLKIIDQYDSLKSVSYKAQG